MSPCLPNYQGTGSRMGGMLSHGACLSREFGLSGITIRNAMQRIEDGAMIEVSGDAGQVRILEPGESDARAMKPHLPSPRPARLTASR